MTLMRGTVHLVTVRDALLLRPLVQRVIERVHHGGFGRRTGGADVAELAAAVRESQPGRSRRCLSWSQPFRPGYPESPSCFAATAYVSTPITTPKFLMLAWSRSTFCSKL
jgi:hypothetical protein